MCQKFRIFICITSLALLPEFNGESAPPFENENEAEEFDELLPLSIPNHWETHDNENDNDNTTSLIPPPFNTSGSDSSSSIDQNQNREKIVSILKNCSKEDPLVTQAKPSKFVHFTEEELSKAKHGWGGNCTEAHWHNCSNLSSWKRSYRDPKYKKEVKLVEYTLDCSCGPLVCLRNGWTVTRCSLLCMSRCNREYLNKYDKYVSHHGKCQNDDLE